MAREATHHVLPGNSDSVTLVAQARERRSKGVELRVVDVGLELGGGDDAQGGEDARLVGGVASEDPGCGAVMAENAALALVSEDAREDVDEAADGAHDGAAGEADDLVLLVDGEAGRVDGREERLDRLRDLVEARENGDEVCDEVRLAVGLQLRELLGNVGGLGRDRRVVVLVRLVDRRDVPELGDDGERAEFGPGRERVQAERLGERAVGDEPGVLLLDLEAAPVADDEDVRSVALGLVRLQKELELAADLAPGCEREWAGESARVSKRREDLEGRTLVVEDPHRVDERVRLPVVAVEAVKQASALVHVDARTARERRRTGETASRAR